MSLREVFADTYYFLALLNSRDEGHQRAVEYTKSSQVSIVTTSFVLTEVADALCSADTKTFFVQLLDLLDDQLTCRIVPANADLFRFGVELYGDRADKSWSLTDCTSFVVMKHEGLTEALTADHHFEQAGFSAAQKS